MPIDIVVEYTDGSKDYFYVPNSLLRYKNPTLSKRKTNSFI